ncbi:hypothetical protein GOV06_01490 [Candidatus Woesearchaeota archaeon]|nr:hypothetical protein [Candidatus Woesearchaeota archaeon]
MPKQEPLEEQLRKIKAKDSDESTAEKLDKALNLLGEYQKTLSGYDSKLEKLKQEKKQDIDDRKINDLKNRLGYLKSSYTQWYDSIMEELHVSYFSCCLQTFNRFRLAIQRELDDLKAQESIVYKLHSGSPSELEFFLKKIGQKEQRHNELKEVYAKNNFKICEDKGNDNVLMRFLTVHTHPKEQLDKILGAS